MDHPLADGCDTIMQLTRAGEITMRQARAMRAHFIGELMRGGMQVEAYESERELLDRYERAFPGERARRLRVEFEAEHAA